MKKHKKNSADKNMNCLIENAIMELRVNSGRILSIEDPQYYNEGGFAYVLPAVGETLIDQLRNSDRSSRTEQYTIVLGTNSQKESLFPRFYVVSHSPEMRISSGRSVDTKIVIPTPGLYRSSFEDNVRYRRLCSDKQGNLVERAGDSFGCYRWRLRSIDGLDVESNITEKTDRCYNSDLSQNLVDYEPVAKKLLPHTSKLFFGNLSELLSG